ncbi:amino acid adenylation domain-containing protein (plasmid) [Streptomyces sp. NBC_01136]|uniref:non-ribosomal peptide synthetase n=1 Tax=unclassified Streptomyces TaxID=2593676 RepID=UPI002F90D0EB|nr:amino acid adenylation domain-containing protein [Streptomyces sp. NBC_01136]
MTEQSLLNRLRELSATQRAALLSVAAERGNDFDIHPLSSAQRRLWLMAQLHADSDPYNVPFALRLRGPLDVDALRGAVTDLTARHASLRTVFLDAEGEPLQVVLPEAGIELEVEDLTAAADREAMVAELVADEARRRFDLAASPLVRARLLQLTEGDAVFLLTLHHLVCDGWSMGIVFDDLATFYTARREGHAATAVPTSWQYSDFVWSHQEWLRSDAPDQLASKAAERLADAPELLELPIDRPRQVGVSAVGAVEWFDWPESLAADLTRFCETEDMTRTTVLLAAFAAVLHRLCGTDDLLLGTPVANRTRQEAADVVGLFVNVLPIRSTLSPTTSFREMVLGTRDELTSCLAHQDLPFDRLVSRLGVTRDATRHPVFQVACTTEDDTGRLQLPGVTVTPMRVHSGTSKLDVTVSFRVGESGISGSVEYDSLLFDAATVRDMITCLRVLLVSGLSDPDRPVWTLPMLDAEQEDRLFRGWGRGARMDSGGQFVHELIEEHADRRPDGPAVSFGAERLGFAELDERANRLAHWLIEAGAGPDSLVAILLDRSVDLVVCSLAAWKAGTAFVPLDPSYPAERLDYLVADSQASMVLTTTALREKSAQAVRTVCLDEVAGEVRRASAERPARRAEDDNLAYVIYTSGSTGRPKGTMLTQAGLRNLALTQREAFRLTPDDRVLQFASSSFDAYVFEVALSLAVGAELVLAPREALQPGADLVETINAGRVTMAVLPPTVAAMMKPDDVPTLHTLLVAGEACPPQLAADWASRRLINGYGPSEITVWATHSVCVPGEHPVPIGRPLPNVDVYVLDQRLLPVQPGAAGELCVAGAGVGRGYLRRPELTAEKYVPDPFSDRPGARMYRTGDIVRYRPDGRLEFLGRLDGQVKVRGLRIELGEIQSALFAQPGIRTCAVAITEEPVSDMRLIAYVVSDSAEAAEPAQLRRALREFLPEFMVPSAFVRVDAVPMTPNGKVDYRALARHKPVRSSNGRAQPAGSALEKQILAAWQQVLGTDDIGVDENFFDAGGNSLLITTLRSRIEQEVGRTVTAVTLFRYPTVRGLAEHLGDDGLADRTAQPVRLSRALLLERSRRAAPGAKGA